MTNCLCYEGSHAPGNLTWKGWSRMVRMTWDPVRDLLSMQERLETLFGTSHPGWVPPVDLVEHDDRYVLSMEVPGVARADVTLEFADHVLTIRGARPAASPDRYSQLERGQGAFTRSFRFAAPVAGDAIGAELVDGVLTVSVPKTSADRRRIEVHGA
jgi:HSP20 family protein